MLARLRKRDLKPADYAQCDCYGPGANGEQEHGLTKAGPEAWTEALENQIDATEKQRDEAKKDVRDNRKKEGYRKVRSHRRSGNLVGAGECPQDRKGK